MKGEGVVGASKPAFYPRNQGSSGAFRSGFMSGVVFRESEGVPREQEVGVD